MEDFKTDTLLMAEAEILRQHWDRVIGQGENISTEQLGQALQQIRDDADNDARDLIANARVAFTETEEERMWREFEEQPRDWSKARQEIRSDDPELFSPTYWGESAAHSFDKVEHNGRTYEKKLRYNSLHEVTKYKTLVRKDVLRGSAAYEYDEEAGKRKEKQKKQRPGKEQEQEVDRLWQEWADGYGSQVYGLREDMLGKRSAIAAFDSRYRDESKDSVQGSLFEEKKGAGAPPKEPKKYTGRIKNPMFDIWAKQNFKPNAPDLCLYWLGDPPCRQRSVFLFRPALSPARWHENNEPEYWIWPEEAEILAKIPKPKRKRQYRIPRSKVRSKSAAFFNVRQSKKFMAFYTVSFPAGIPDDLAYKLFNTWLTRLRDKKRGIGLRSYLWVAERQEGKHRDKAVAALNKKRENALAQAKSEAEKKKVNGFYDKKIADWKPTHSVHFHLLTNNYMPVWTANHFMRAALKTKQKTRKYSFLDGFNMDSYNGVDVKFVGNNRKRLGYYLTKYITKNDTAIEHAVWHCSRNISSLFTEQLSEEEKRGHMWKMLQEHYCRNSDGTEKEGAKVPVYKKNGQYVDKTWLPPWVLVKNSGLLIDTNQEIFDLSDTGAQLQDGLLCGYRQMPLRLVWKEIKQITAAPGKKRRMFWKERLQAGIKAAKKKLKKALFAGADRQSVNNKLIQLWNVAVLEGLEF